MHGLEVFVLFTLLSSIFWLNRHARDLFSIILTFQMSITTRSSWRSMTSPRKDWKNLRKSWFCAWTNKLRLWWFGRKTTLGHDIFETDDDFFKPVHIRAKLTLTIFKKNHLWLIICFLISSLCSVATGAGYIISCHILTICSWDFDWELTRTNTLALEKSESVRQPFSFFCKFPLLHRYNESSLAFIDCPNF